MGSAIVTSERTEEALTWVSDPSCVLQSINKTDFNPLLALVSIVYWELGWWLGGKIHTKDTQEYLGSLQPPVLPVREERRRLLRAEPQASGDIYYCHWP